MVEFKVNRLPTNLQPNSLYYVKVDTNKFQIYLTDTKCPPTAYNLESAGSAKIVTSPDGSIQVIETATETQIQVSNAILAQINSALQAGDNISELINDAGYITSADLPNATAIRREEFGYTGGSQIFTLSNDFYQVFSVEVQGQGALSTSQYSLITPNKVQILDTLNINDYVVVLYGEDLLTTAVPYYTQAEVDSLIGQDSKVFNETPSGVLDGINTTYTSLYNFIPETVEVFLNGMFQKKIDDFQTAGLNTITMNISPTSTETILINYIKQ